MGSQHGARTPAAGDPAVALYNGGFRVDYRATNGTIHNSFWTGSRWIHNTVPGPAAAGDPAVAVYNGEFHVDYRTRNATIQTRSERIAVGAERGARTGGGG